jgi:hypothetical protein
LRKSPFELALAAVAVVIGLVAVLRPLFLVRYPAMTDLPFHGASVAAFRHWFDPSYHFQDQFTLHPVAVPYLTHYVLGALFALVLPVVQATKLATAVVLGLVPVGVAVLAWGMKKSPLLGLGALPLVWCELTHWGFINFVGAIGLFAACLGLTMRLVDAPTQSRAFALGGSLLLVLVTHPFRFPFAVLAVALTAILLTRDRDRLRPLLLPVSLALSCFAAFYLSRPATMSDGVQLALSLERLGEIPEHLLGAFDDPRESVAAERHLEVLGLVALVGGLFASWDRPTREERAREEPPPTRRYAIATHLAVILSIAGLMLGYLTLPMEIGAWWYVYPREVSAAAVLVPALVPDLPRPLWLRASLVAALGLSSLGASEVVADNYRRFDATTVDFDAVTAELPRAPKLAYLVFDHAGSTRTNTPYIHLPAWVQAERGGWLSFHFAALGGSPLRYRDPAETGAIVPPQVPSRFEWTPERFDMKRQGAFFDWFLVRSSFDPARMFRSDPNVERKAQQGKWWLYGRKRTRPDAADPATPP